jgi:spermidine synthase
MPTLPTGTWGFACCGKQSFDPNLTVMPNQADTEMFGNPLQYYNHAVHKAAFAIPNFITQLLKSR